eukprot:TRINITY_DN4927_c1_g1_i1.p1 TRINITY_DN4927_c1_g1~~TRINITY_DN4927_c1_g1_i1.p1  ORF type:complete len:200 (-),score=117.50 TRINITY_DN4927_c1_g1_i1:89-625(-)
MAATNVNDVPALETPAAVEVDDKHSKSEKKARKAIEKLGLRKYNGIVRVTIKKSKNVLFVIAKPDVYKNGADTWVVFGDAKIEDTNSSALAQRAAALAAENSAGHTHSDSCNHGDKTEAVVVDAAEKKDEDEAVDETGLEAKDIELVVAQGNVSRARAVKALRENNGDIVNAIMALTM